MATKMDEIHKLAKPSSKKTKNKSIPYDDYFGEMRLDSVEVEERISLSYELEDAFKYIFGVLAVLFALDKAIDDYQIYRQLTDRLNDIVKRYDKRIVDDTYTTDHIRNLVWEVVDTTVKHKDDAYYLSDDRARYIAENEANSFGNYRQLRTAMDGSKKYKTWLSMRDQHVRQTHVESDGQVVPIDKPFIVGDSQMMFPKDETLGASADEIVGCRCSAEYF